ncbi:glyoxalase [Aurantibacter sp.]|uniref:glyoxalase n=1 Tax=Aurantibacter sp. TaxID=2807103 RepID=UPI0035C855D6
METRTNALLSIRPVISSAQLLPNMSAGEYFQNATLRPVIKFQNDLLIASLRNYITKHKNVFYELTLERRQLYIDNAINKDIKFRNALKGIIIGQFTTKEYTSYIKNSSALNKRMMNLVKQRLQDQIQLFDMPNVLEAF